MNKIRITLAAVFAVGGAAFIAKHEGVEKQAYVDPVGIWTICAGHTATAYEGATATDEVCDYLLKHDMSKAFKALERHVEVPLTPERGLALTSFVFNVGEGNFKKSTLLQKLNAGEISGACDELRRWVYAGGRKLPGLVKRREAERELCLR